jgi:hypothetical protein
MTDMTDMTEALGKCCGACGYWDRECEPEGEVRFCTAPLPFGAGARSSARTRADQGSQCDAFAPSETKKAGDQ